MAMACMVLLVMSLQASDTGLNMRPIVMEL